MRAIATSAQTVLGSDGAVCVMLSETPSHATTVGEVECTPPEAIWWGEAAIVGGFPLAIEDRTPEPPSDHAPRAVLGAAIRSHTGAESVGAVLGLYHAPRAFTASDLRALRGVADLATVALGKAHEHEGALQSLREARRQAAVDSLTGLVNRRVLYVRLNQEVARAHRHDHPLAVAVLDVDHFKGVNDVHGHPVGDDVLREMARRLRACARRSDLVARVGGEEFAWLMPETTGEDALSSAERARAMISARPFPGAGPVTASIGVSELQHGEDARELMRRADQALYAAKHRGRDITQLHSPA